MVQKVKRIDVVFNIYQETSIKAAERFHRESKTNIHLKNTAASHKNTIVQLHQQYSSNTWLKNGKKEIVYRDKPYEKILCTTCKFFCFKRTKDDSSEMIPWVHP